jgi:hypothetical protein
MQSDTQAVCDAIDGVSYDWSDMEQAHPYVTAAAALSAIAKQGVHADVAVGETALVVRVDHILRVANELENKR